MPPTWDGATPHDHPGHRTGPAPVAQWLGLGLAPAVFLAHLQANYMLVYWSCNEGMDRQFVHLASAVAVLLAGLGVWCAWLAWTRSGAESPGEASGPTPRTRLLAACGLGVSALATLLLLAQFVSGFVVPMCQ
jgi:hypothetical protein